MATKIIVLAAGKGTRMKSALPKVVHALAGKPLLAHVLDNVVDVGAVHISIVIGHGAKDVQDAMLPTEQALKSTGIAIDWVMQTEQLGTGHAVQQALSNIDDGDDVIVAYGDVPLTRPETFSGLLSLCDRDTLGLLTVKLDDPNGYGRIVRDSQGSVTGIVEQKDASSDQLRINEINSGMLSANGGMLKNLLSKIKNDNAQGEYYLTDIFALAVQSGDAIKTVHPQDDWEVSGVNSRTQLAELERIHQQVIANDLMESGVTLIDPARVDVRGKLKTGTDVLVDINTVFIGENTIASNVSIGANCTIINSVIGVGTTIHPNSIVENAVIGENCNVGPFARLRPGSDLDDSARIGNFVEIKNASIGKGSKVNHLSYVGDAEVGTNVNVGAGTITCNYDGANKSKTVMEDDVFIGSNSALVAPVTVGKGATVGAGAVITRDVRENVLVVVRAKAREIDGWERPVKKKK